MAARLGTICILVLASLALAVPANATFPGANGKIAFERGGDIWTMNPDGTNQVNLTNDAPVQTDPAWSPDGTRIAFNQPAPSSPAYIKTWWMLADGSNRTLADDGRTTCCFSRYFPAWSPDGTRLAFVAASGLLTMNPDGTGVFDTGAPGTGTSDWSPDGKLISVEYENRFCFDHNPILIVAHADGSGWQDVTPDPACDGLDFVVGSSWSPDSQRLLYSNGALYTIKPDGTDRQQLPGSGGADPVWSPDGTKIAFGTYGSGSRISIMNADGNGVTDITDGRNPSWQPIPINSYPRPRGASPMRISLVPAYPPCTSPDRAHGAPLAFGSCANPQLVSQHLTVGTPDANGKRTTMQASILLRVTGGASPDVRVDAIVNNVFNKDLSDYTGGLRARLPLQITDKDNTPSPGGPGAATTEQIPFDFDLACTATPDTTIGSDCPLSTTANALVPGSVSAGLRAIWQLGQAQVYDGGADGNPVTASDNTLFLDQGIFVP